MNLVMRIGRTTRPMVSVMAAAFAVASLVAGSLLGPETALAGSGDRGSRVVCDYHYLGENSRYWGGKLVHIDVTPPTMYAIPGASTVVWRFNVERYIFDTQDWTQTYLSPKEGSTATGSQPGTFTTMGVDVALPRIPGYRQGAWNEVYYRVKIKLFWYGNDGTTIKKTIVHQMVHYDNTFEGEYGWSDTGNYSCPGGHSAYVDGP